MGLGSLLAGPVLPTLILMARQCYSAHFPGELPALLRLDSALGVCSAELFRLPRPSAAHSGSAPSGDGSVFPTGLGAPGGQGWAVSVPAVFARRAGVQWVVLREDGVGGVCRRSPEAVPSWTPAQSSQVLMAA